MTKLCACGGKHLAKGMCKRCYNAEYFRTVRSPDALQWQGRTLYPQAVVRVSVPGWGVIPS